MEKKLSIFTVNGTHAIALHQMLLSLAKTLGFEGLKFEEFVVHLPFSCQTFSTVGGNGNSAAFLEEALKQNGVFEECPECAKSKKWEDSWKTHNERFPRLRETADAVLHEHRSVLYISQRR